MFKYDSWIISHSICIQEATGDCIDTNTGPVVSLLQLCFCFVDSVLGLSSAPKGVISATVPILKIQAPKGESELAHNTPY